MASPLLEQILAETKAVDKKYQQLALDRLQGQKISFPVGKDHPRFSSIKNYPLSCRHLTAEDLAKSALIFVDYKIAQEPWLKKLLKDDAPIIFLKAHEIEYQEIISLSDSLQHIEAMKKSHITAIGPGPLLYAVGYIAEKWECDSTYIPTTALSMSDTSTGGKVRIHRVKDNVYERHYYRSYYEPNEVIVDSRFLRDVPEHEVSSGVAEIVKHALYQSAGLLEYLLSNDFDPFNKKNTLLKAILWTAALKRTCLSVDPQETSTGANTILRAAHHISDQLEIESKLQMRHGNAVWRAMEIDTKSDETRARNFQLLAQKLWKK